MRKAHKETSLRALVDQHGTIQNAADAVGLSKSTFFRRLQKEESVAPAAAPTMEALMASLVESQAQIARMLCGTAAGAIVVPPVAAAKAMGSKPGKVEKPIAGGTLEVPEARERRASGRRWILTCAQNNTVVHERLLAAFLIYCERNDAELLVAPFTYNKNAWQNSAKITTESEGIWYDPAIEPFLCRDPIRLAKDFIFCADYDRLPTRDDPLSGVDGYTKESSGAFPHVKVRVKSCATMKHAPAKMLYTTGTLTQRNYIRRAAGMTAQFHHTFAGLLVEVDDEGIWFARQLVADDHGDFSDLENFYTAEGVRPAQIEAITWFDIHAEKAPEGLLASCFDGATSILDTLRPRHQFIHDVTDFEARNHHNIKSPYHLARMRHRGTETVEGNVEKSAAFLARIERPWCKSVVVESNHDQAFLKWLEFAEGHSDPANAEYWHRWNLEVFRAIRQDREGYLVFEHAVRDKADLPHTVFLPEDESYVTCEEHGGIENGCHGHRGANGARGGPKAYKGMGIRVNRGDQHSASIVDNVYTSGASAMEMGYNKGLSSWSVTFTITYANSKRTLVTIRDGKWRAEPIRQKPRIRVPARSIAT